MDLATVVLTAAVAFIFILQMITMIQVRTLKKASKDVKNEEPGFPNQKFPQKDRDMIRDKRRVDKPQFQETQAKPQTPITSVERSLRDINLRLKNAERDQERARRKMDRPEERLNENRPREERPRNDRPRDGRPHGNRPRDNRPHGNRPHDKRPHDRRPVNDGSKQVFKRRDYNENVMPKPQEPVPTVPEEKKPLDSVFSPVLTPPVLTPPVLTPPVLTPPVLTPSVLTPSVLKEEIPTEVKQAEPVAPVTENTGSQEQAFGRGSKITVKRRTLNGEGAEPEKASDGQSVPAPAVIAETPGEQNISFGRR